MPFNANFPNLRPTFKRGTEEPLQPKEIMTGAFRNSAASAGLTNLSSAGDVDPLKEYDYELQSQELQNKATDIRARLQQQRLQDTLGQVQNERNRQTRQWQNQKMPTAPMFRSFKNPSPQFQAFAQAISGQESGGNYGAVNSSSGAMGRYQIMPSNIAGPGGWDQQVLGRNITPQKFLHSPKVQDRIALHMLQGMFQKEGVRGAASQWYSGDPNAWRGAHGGSQQENAPSIANYANSILQRYNRILPRIQARQRAFTEITGQATGLRGLQDPLKGKGNWQFGAEGDWGRRSIGQGFHTGIDFDVPQGTPVYASQSGRIGTANFDSGYGNQIFVNGANRTETRYQHLSRFAKGLNRGDRVRKGQLIGYSGDTGSFSQGAHLHFETLRRRRNNAGIDPRRIEQGWTSVNPMRFFRRYT
jgi:murein DD-endopeptidase MepM/ murein hydrolase activator NlpD